MLYRKFLIILFCWLSLCATVLAEYSLPWKTDTYTTIARSQNIADVLHTFANNQKMNIVVDPSVQGVLSGQFINLSPQKFFDNLVQSYNLIWFFDGVTLYVTVGTQITSSIIQLSYTLPEQLVAVFNDMKFASSNWSIRSLPDEDLIFFSGPPRFVEMMSQLGAQLDQANQKKLSGVEMVKVFPLTYAWAYDVTYTYGDNSIQVPGIANIVAALMQGKIPAGMMGVKEQPGLNVIKPGMDKEIPQVTMPSVILKEDKEDQASPMYAQKKKAIEANTAPGNIIPDPRTNSVIIKDVQNKLPLYEQLIKQLDVPTKVIEITAAIVDISKGSGYDVGLQLFNGLTPEGNPVAYSTSAGDNFNINNNFNPSTTTMLIQGTIQGFKFWNAIHALENKNKAKILARPSILTLDNTQAIIDRKSKKYIQVSSERQANLFDASVGLTMKVTPHFIERPQEHNQIKLLVNIEDGAFEVTSSSAIPASSTQQSINTQAIIDEGESLLIGGHYDTTETTTRSGVPILNKIPILGVAFREDTKTKTCVERFYLITPRVLETLAADPKYKKVYTSTENFTAPAFTGCNHVGWGEACSDVTYLGDNFGGDPAVAVARHATNLAATASTGGLCNEMSTNPEVMKYDGRCCDDCVSTVCRDCCCKEDDCCRQAGCAPVECCDYDYYASCPDRSPCAVKGVKWSSTNRTKNNLLTVNDLMAPNANACYVQDPNCIDASANVCSVQDPCSETGYRKPQARVTDDVFVFKDGTQKVGRVLCRGDRCSEFATVEEKVVCPGPNPSRQTMRRLKVEREPMVCPCPESQSTRPVCNEGQMVCPNPQGVKSGFCKEPKETLVHECIEDSGNRCKSTCTPRKSTCNSWEDWFGMGN
jgi:type III secretion protein C